MDHHRSFDRRWIAARRPSDPRHVVLMSRLVLAGGPGAPPPLLSAGDPGAPPPAQPGRPRRSPTLAFLLSFFLPGAGQIYVARYLSAIVWLAAACGLWFVSGWTLGWIVHLVAARAAQRYAISHCEPNESHEPLKRLRGFFRERYMTIDPRTAGVFRLALGFLLTLDTIRHSNEARLLYSNVGVLSNDWHLYQPTSSFEFSIFHMFSTLAEVRVLFALGVIAHVLLFVGYRSRLFAFLSFV